MIPCLPKRGLEVPAEAGRYSEEYDAAALFPFPVPSLAVLSSLRPSPGVPPLPTVLPTVLLSTYSTVLPPYHPTTLPSYRLRLASLLAFPRSIPQDAEIAGIRECEPTRQRFYVAFGLYPLPSDRQNIAVVQY